MTITRFGMLAATIAVVALLAGCAPAPALPFAQAAIASLPVEDA